MLTIAGKIFLLLLIGITVVAFSRRAKFLISLLKLGKAEDRSDQVGKRLKFALGQVLPQRCVLKHVAKGDFAGIGHMLLFYGFSFFVISYGFHIAEGFYEKLSPAPFGRTFNNLFFLLLDIAGLTVITSIVWAAIRRYIIRPSRLKPSMEAGIILIVVFSLMLLSFFTEGFRLLSEETPFTAWAFVGMALANLFLKMGLQDKAFVLFQFFWWAHMTVIFGFGIYILYSKHLHILASHFNLFFHSTGPKGSLQQITDMEEAESFGISKITEFSWKHLLDLYACTECGRCTDNCPASNSGKHLKPEEVIQNLKKHLFASANHLLAEKAGEKQEETEEQAMIGEVVTEEEVWDCTNCMACMEICPVAIEHVNKIDDMRRYLVLMESKFPSALQTAFRNMENNSNPWGIGAHTRADWAKDLGIKTLTEDPNVEYLFYVGCAGSFDDRGKKVSVAFANILKAAGVSFGILGSEEGCCGDSAMRGGNEYLYQIIAQANIETMNGYGVKKIITTCPHGYNIIKKDYPQFGGNYEVYHHTEFIADLIAQGKIKLKKPLEGLFTYHDSCFLGRYNDIYDQPRKILQAIPGMKLTEMERNHARSFCCGAGGARMWMEEDVGERINDMRTDQAIATKADTIAVGCPFCLTMLTDGIKDRKREETMTSLDIAEIVWKAMDL